MDRINITIVLPSLNPDERLTKIINSLVESGFDDIILVNDGSDAEHTKFFPRKGEIPGVTVLNHAANMGKGEAMKTAFKYFLENRLDSAGVVTIDGDGQHLLPDIINISKEVIAHPEAMILGVRNFNKSNIPARSKVGNKVTSFIFKTGIGLKISDTQTGLRGLSREILPYFVKTPGSRFEYETNQLLDLTKYEIPVREVEITTVYEEGNRTSHFRPIIDSVKIYANILKFGSSSLIAFAVDFIIYTILTKWILPDNLGAGRIYIAAAGARIVSSLINFLFTKRLVFKHKGNASKSIVKYYILVVCQLLCSATLIHFFSHILRLDAGSTSTIKIFVDVALFFASYYIQKKWVFKKEPRKEE